jgi:F420-0:gamma-glutamyl ligase
VQRDGGGTSEGGGPPHTSSTIVSGGSTWERIVVRTPWLHPGDDVGEVLAAHLVPLAVPGDLFIVSEKALTIALGHGIPITDIAVTSLAARLAARVRPRGDSKGLSVPEKMQYLIDTAGRWRVVLALAGAALTRPLGISGAFYVVAGWRARAIDGGRPPFESLLLPPLSPRSAAEVAKRLEAATGYNVAVVDMNDRGGSIRAISGGPMTSRRLRRVLQDNPLGQRDARTPVGIVRRVVAPPTG